MYPRELYPTEALLHKFATEAARSLRMYEIKEKGIYGSLSTFSYFLRDLIVSVVNYATCS